MDGLAAAAARAQFGKGDQKHAGGVPAQMRRGGVGGFAGGGDLRAAIAKVAQVKLEAARGGDQLEARAQGGNVLAADHGAGNAGHHIGALAGVEFVDGDLRTFLAAGVFGEQHVQPALFDVDDRIFGVRGEAVVRRSGVGVVVGHVGHAGFLVAAEDEAHGVLEFHAGVAHAAHGVERGQRRALVVEHAAADEVAVLLRQRKRFHRPAVAGGHHVQMAEDAQRLFARAHGDVAGIAVEHAGGKAVAARVLQRQIEHAAVLAAKGRAFLRRALHGGHGEPAAQILQKFIAARLDERVELCVVHFQRPPLYPFVSL